MLVRVTGLLWILPASVLGAAYNETLAVQYAKLAGAAYCSAASLSSWACGVKCIPGVTSVRVCKGESVKAVVGLWDGKCFSSFEGTNGINAVGEDLDSVILEDFSCDGCKVHRGFLGEWENLATCTTNSFTEIGCDPMKPIHATGHSLGAAVMTLAMMDLSVAGWNIKEMYSFGMPRVGDAQYARNFQQRFKGRFFRVTHGRDPFIDMPPLPSFVHVEPEVFYKTTVADGFVICDDPFDRRCAAQYFPDAQDVIFESSRAYHHNYMGVDTTQAGCQRAQESCDDDIQLSWCAYGIACNTDVRGEQVHCHYGPLYKGGLGKCHCNLGYCPEAGKCVPRASHRKGEYTVVVM